MLGGQPIWNRLESQVGLRFKGVHRSGSEEALLYVFCINEGDVEASSVQEFGELHHRLNMSLSGEGKHKSMRSAINARHVNAEQSCRVVERQNQAGSGMLNIVDMYL